jgi:hypothetical protein
LVLQEIVQKKKGEEREMVDQSEQSKKTSTVELSVSSIQRKERSDLPHPNGCRCTGFVGCTLDISTPLRRAEGGAS